MPSDSDGDTRAVTFGRDNKTTIYSNANLDSELFAHENVHTFPQNVRKAEAGGIQAALPHHQRPWEKEAIEFGRMIDSGKDICALITGESLGPDPVKEYYKNYDYRPFWKKFLGIK